MGVPMHQFLAYFVAILVGVGIGATWTTIVIGKQKHSDCGTMQDAKYRRDDVSTVHAPFERQLSTGEGKMIIDDPIVLPPILARQLAVVEVGAESASSATGGKVFKMTHIRTYQGQRLDSSQRPETFPPPDDSEMCERWAVITSIFEPTDAVRELAATEGWCVVVVGDENGECLARKRQHTLHTHNFLFDELRSRSSINGSPNCRFRVVVERTPMNKPLTHVVQTKVYTIIDVFFPATHKNETFRRFRIKAPHRSEIVCAINPIKSSRHSSGHYRSLIPSKVVPKTQTFGRLFLPQARPPTRASFYNERFMAAQHKEGYYRKKKVPILFLVCEGLTIDDIGVSRDTVCQEIRPGAGSSTGDLVEEKLGGASVE